MRISLALLFTSLIGLANALAAPVINEVMSSNGSSLTDEDGDFPDWIELYNPEDTAYSLEGHFLTDDENAPAQWAFPGIEIPAQGYLIIFASGKDRSDEESELHANFRVNQDGEFVALVAADGETVVSGVQVPPLERDHTYIAVIQGSSRVYQVSNDPTPGAENSGNVVLFSIPGQAFTETLSLELSTPDGTPIRYTEDGREATLFNGRNYTGPITIDKTKIIAARTGNGPIRSQVYIKVSPALAERDSNIPLVIVDASNSLSQSSFSNMAIGVMEVGAEGRTRLVREFSTHSRGGIRTRGETSNSFPKKPLRFEFWDEKGEDRKLPVLGMPTDADWILNARYTFDRTLVHNAWIYEMSNQIGQYAPRTRFVELYLNEDEDPVDEGDYFGVYTFMENIARSDERVDVETMPIEATEEPEITGGYIFRKDKTDPGTWDINGGGVGLQMIYPPDRQQAERAHQGAWISNYLDDMRDRIRDGSDPETGYPSVIDERSWIDHQLLNLLPLNVDALRLSAYFYKKREGKVMAGPVWDFDRSAGGPSDSRIGEAETWRGSGGDEGTHFFSNRGSGAAGGTPVWWHDLFENSDFHTAWADRWHALREDEFSDENIARIINGMHDELAEAAERNFQKWPGAPPRPASQLEYSDVGGFEGEIKHMIGWLQTRAAWITDNLITVPTFTPAEVVHAGPVEVTMKAGGSLFKADEIYYTTDGSDPRAMGGDPSATAVKYSGAVNFTESTRILARNRDDDYEQDPNGPPQTWSGLAEARYFIGEEPASNANLVVSEIMYNPPNPTAAEESAGFENNDDFEFLELLNLGSSQVSLSGARLRGVADFDFPEGMSLAPGERLVLVRNAEAFAERYGTDIQPAGVYSDRLPNSDGRIFLRAHDRSTIHEFTYLDDEPWPQDADGEGKSLVLNNAMENPDPSLAESWSASVTELGTPGRSEDSGPGDGFDVWLAGHFTEAELADPEISGASADLDHDGLPVLGEYLVGGDPKVFDGDKFPVLSLADGHLNLTYQRQEGLSDVEATLELSVDLVTWTSGAEVEEVSVTANGDGTETVVLRDVKALADQKARYARLRITRS